VGALADAPVLAWRGIRGPWVAGVLQRAEQA